jgi:D-alanyl-D-alanine carboxypeptidase
MKKRRIKKKAKIMFAVVIILIVGLIIGIKQYKTYLYHQTYEYKLLQKNYNADEVKVIQNKLNDEGINKLLDSDYIPKLVDFLQEKYFIYNNLDRYLSYYQKNPTKDLSEIVTLINVNRDSNYYENTTPTDTSKDTLMLVNKYNYLSQDYTPDNLVNVSSSYAYDGNIARQDVLDAFKEMYNDALKDDITLILNSSYRSYSEQDETWLTRKKAYGTEKADQYAARAGYSEHQTGLALDINQFNTTEKDFENTPAFTWLSNNAYKYGFILRYPEGKENITGYSYESWHYRYVGKDVAKKITDEGITFDEYYAYYIAN